MIIFVDNEHPTAYDKPWAEKIMAARTRIKYRLEDLSGDSCLIVRYDRVTPELLNNVNARAIFISGNSANPDAYLEDEQAGLRAVLLEKRLPTFGFCGGHQVMAETYGAELAPIGPLDPGQEEPELTFAPGLKKELGYLPTPLTATHPVLAGLAATPVFRHAHSWEVKTMPAGFRNYAATATTALQLLIHDELPLMSTQFHPEYYTDEHPEGKTLIHNFMAWSGLLS